MVDSSIKKNKSEEEQSLLSSYPFKSLLLWNFYGLLCKAVITNSNAVMY